MPLTESVSFKATMQKGNRIQVPRLIRWQFKLESTQVLNVSVKVVGSFGVREEFYARMSKDGRITIPKLFVDLLKEEEESLVDYALEVILSPAEVEPTQEE